MIETGKGEEFSRGSKGSVWAVWRCELANPGLIVVNVHTNQPLNHSDKCVALSPLRNNVTVPRI